MTPGLLLTVAIIYFGILYVISWYTSRNADNSDFFIGGRQSNWLLVAIGMIGTSLSGVTFISIPGVVGMTPELMKEITGEATVKSNIYFSYMQMVFGYLLGYFVIATVLMPIYYKHNLTSIYTYLEQKMGFFSYKTGAAYFMLSRIIGCSFRIFLVVLVLQRIILEPFGVPFWLTVAITMALVFLNSHKGGIKTIVVTDTVQTVAMLVAVILTVYFIGDAMGKSVGDLVGTITRSEYSQMFFFEGGWSDPNNFFKQFISGALIAIVMTGLDQDMMQKNLSCKNIGEAQKNMFTFSVILVFANLLFLAMGALLYIYGNEIGLDYSTRSDLLYPTIALQHLPTAAGVVFFIGLIAAAYSSADSALTALTTSFCIDFLDFEKKEENEETTNRTRKMVHLGVTGIVFGTVLLFNAINDDAVINNLFKIAGYTYGPLLGLFIFAIGTNTRAVRDQWVPVVCLVAPILAWYINEYASQPPIEFTFGFLIVALNGLLTLIGLLAISYPKKLK